MTVLVEGFITPAEKGVLGLMMLVTPEGEQKFGYLVCNGDKSVTWKSSDEYRHEIEDY